MCSTHLKGRKRAKIAGFVVSPAMPPFLIARLELRERRRESCKVSVLQNSTQILHLCGLKIRVVLHEFKLKLVCGGDFLLSLETLGKIALAVTRCRELSVFAEVPN